jgi:hypothetical protein
MGEGRFRSYSKTLGWSGSLERLARDKHSSLFGLFMIYEEKSFIILAPGINIIRLFFFVIPAPSQ